MFKKNENLGSQKRDLYKNVHSSHIHNGPKLEMAQIPRKLEKKKLNCRIFAQWNTAQEQK